MATEGAKAKKTLKLKLKYDGKKGVIEGLRRVSTPGLRRYVSSARSRVCGVAWAFRLSRPPRA